MYTIIKVSETEVKKSRTKGTDYEIRFNDIDLHDPSEVHHALPSAFDSIIDGLTTGIPPYDMVRLVLQTNQLEYPISIPFMARDELTSEKMLSRVEPVLQSHETFNLDDTVSLNFFHVGMPQPGSGRRLRRKDFFKLQAYLEKKKSLIRIRNQDELGCARAIVAAKAAVDNHRYYESIRQGGGRQEQMARQLHLKANVPLGPCGLRDRSF